MVAATLYSYCSPKGKIFRDLNNGKVGEHDTKNHRKLQIPRGNNKPQEIYEKPNIRIKKKSRGGTPNHPHYSWGPHPKRHTNGNYMELIETCIIPIITYACELWDPNKEEKGQSIEY